MNLTTKDVIAMKDFIFYFGLVYFGQELGCYARDENTNTIMSIVAVVLVIVTGVFGLMCLMVDCETQRTDS